MSCGPQKNKLNIDRIITQTGIIGEFDIENNDVIRFLVENAVGGTTFTIKMKLKGQTGYVSIATLSGSASEVIKSDTYDLMELECTVLGGTNIRLIASGFQDGE